MSEASSLPADAGAPLFSPATAALIVVVGVFAFCALAVLLAYAPDLETGNDGGAHALSKSAVGYAGMAEAVRLAGEPVLISRHRLPKGRRQGLLLETPPAEAADDSVTPMGFAGPVLVVLPKWVVAPDPRHRGWVRKIAPLPDNLFGKAALITRAGLTRRNGVARPTLHAVSPPFPAGASLIEGPVDRLQTMSLKGWAGWRPVLVDETGATVMAKAPYGPVYLLSDPDLLNNQGLKNFDTLTSGLAMVNGLRAGGGPVIFDVTLNGLGQERTLLKLAFSPPFLAVTLCLAAAAVLAGFQAFCRFGPVRGAGRAVALGKAALVDNTAALMRLAGREHRMGGPYADITRDLTAKSLGAPRGLSGEALTEFLDRVADTRGVNDRLSTLAALARAASDRVRLTALAERLFDWRLEMTGDS